MKFFIFTLKSKIKLMPVLCAIMLIFMGSFYIITLNSKNKVINLEIYFDEQDSKNNMIISLINGTASTKSNLSLSTSYDLQSSQSKLEDGDIDVLIKVPANFYNSILNSVGNHKCKVSYSHIDLSSLLLQSDFFRLFSNNPH